MPARKNLCARRAISLLPFALFAVLGASASGQEITNLTTWTPHKDPFSGALTATASAPVVNLHDARATITATCRRRDRDTGGDVLFPSVIDYKIAISGTVLDAQTRSISHESGTWLAPIVTYSQDTVISVRLKYGNNNADEMTLHPVDAHSFVISGQLRELADGEKVAMNDALIGFSANGAGVVLGYSGKQPTFLKFANDCYSPSPEQAKLIKETKDRKLADAEQARRAAEQQRLAQAQAAEQQRIAAEQQRIAAEQATEQARVRSEQRRQMFMTWRENFAKSLGLQSIPECDKSILNKNMASRHSVVFTTTKETKLYDANPSIMKSTKSRRLLANLQFWGNIPSTTRPTEGPYVWVEGTVNGDKGTEWWGTLPIDSIEVCSLVGQIP